MSFNANPSDSVSRDQELSRKHKKDYYQRLIYTAADRSERMLNDLLRHGVLSQHPGRYRVRQADAMQPEALGRDVAFRQGEPVTRPLTGLGSPNGPGSPNGLGSPRVQASSVNKFSSQTRLACV